VVAGDIPYRNGCVSAPAFCTCAFCLLYVCSSTSSGDERLGSGVCLRVGSLVDENGNRRQHWWHGFHIRDSVQCKFAFWVYGQDNVECDQLICYTLDQFAGTNIGTTILLCRVIQTWQQIHFDNNIPITDRTFWGTVYGMALGVNYGAFSTAFSASLAGLLWRDILGRKHIRIRRLDFARVNLPIIAIAMAVGCTVLIGEVYIFRNNSSYDS
jgi:hypothetical protein